VYNAGPQAFPQHSGHYTTTPDGKQHRLITPAESHIRPAPGEPSRVFPGSPDEPAAVTVAGSTPPLPFTPNELDDPQYDIDELIEAYLSFCDSPPSWQPQQHNDTHTQPHPEHTNPIDAVLRGHHPTSHQHQPEPAPASSHIGRPSPAG